MSFKKYAILASAGALVLSFGCRKTNTVDKSAFQSAIDSYLTAQPPLCVWSSPVKFPAQADTSNEDQTKGFDALTDAGLLTRTPAEKKRYLIGSKQVNDYDLSDQGRSSWTPEQTEPGYGNFCFGHLQVMSVDSYPPANPEASQYTVSFHEAVSSIPGWASSTEMKTAFPTIAADTSGQQTATATLAKTPGGWQVTNVNPAPGQVSLPQ
jgi:hypothetical protein